MKKIQVEEGFKFEFHQGWKFCHKNNCDSIIIGPKTIERHEWHRCGFFWRKLREDVYSVSSNDVRYMIYDKSLFSSSCSIADAEGNISFKGLKSKDVKEVEAYVKAHSEKLSMDAKVYPVRTFSLFTKEKISANKEAIIYSKKTLFGSKCAYVQYDEVTCALFIKKFLTRKRLWVASNSADFITKGSVGGKIYKMIRDDLKEKIDFDSGKRYRPSIFSGIKGRRKLTLTFTDDRIVYSDLRNKNALEMLINTAVTDKPKCKPFFSLSKTLEFSGDNYNITFPGVGFFEWFGIKKHLKDFR